MTIRPGTHETSTLLCAEVWFGCYLGKEYGDDDDDEEQMLIVGQLIATHWPTEKQLKKEKKRQKSENGYKKQNQNLNKKKKKMDTKFKNSSESILKLGPLKTY